MAAEGTRLTDFSVTSAHCTPSRASLMTGKYPGRVGPATGVLRPDAQTGLPAHETTLAEVLRQSGRTTGCIGKWHLGFLPGMRPMDQGVDSYYGVLHNLDKFESIPLAGQPFNNQQSAFLNRHSPTPAPSHPCRLSPPETAVAFSLASAASSLVGKTHVPTCG